MPCSLIPSTTGNEDFTRKMEAAVASLLTQRNVEEAARAVGVSVPTLMRWQKLPEFQAAYREARRMAYSQAVAKLQQGTTAAATTLLKVMLDIERQHRGDVQRRVGVRLQQLGGRTSFLPPPAGRRLLLAFALPVAVALDRRHVGMMQQTVQ